MAHPRRLVPNRERVTCFPCWVGDFALTMCVNTLRSANMIEGGGVIHGSAGDRERRPPHLSAASFPIVAVGASAGGLAPTVELLRSLGTEPKVAVVVVHHLDPTHESGLVEVLSRATAMSVATALDDARRCV